MLAALPAPRPAPSHAGQPTRHSVTASAEFAFLCDWLGRCTGIRMLTPERSGLPDGCPLIEIDFADAGTCLVHVRVKADSRLSFKAEPFEAMRDHARRQRRPLLIAWKHFARWSLTDAAHFHHTDANHTINHQTACRQNLLGVLAGDHGWSLPTGAGIALETSMSAIAGTASVRCVTGLGAASVPLCDWSPAYRQILAFTPLHRRIQAWPETMTVYEAGHECGYLHQFVVDAFNHGRPDPRLPYAGVLAAEYPRDEDIIPARRAILDMLDDARADGLVDQIFVPRPHDLPDFLLR
jgi:hypothetical protein